MCIVTFFTMIAWWGVKAHLQERFLYVSSHFSFHCDCLAGEKINGLLRFIYASDFCAYCHFPFWGDWLGEG